MAVWLNELAQLMFLHLGAHRAGQGKAAIVNNASIAAWGWRRAQGADRRLRRRRDIETLIRTRDAQCPMGHMGDAWDNAYAALYLDLASDEARYVTGIPLNVDGGMSIRFV